MISENSAKSYCKDDISLIENYDKAAADKSLVWHCHHRRELVMSRKELIEIGEYYNRPACELIFLTKSEHMRLHHLDKPLSEDTRKKMSESRKDKPSGMNGKHHSAEARKKMSESKKGKPSGMKGKHLSEETRKKISDSKNGKYLSEETRKKMSEANMGKNRWTKGTQWFNNGVKSIRAKTCPEGFVKGRIKL